MHVQRFKKNKYFKIRRRILSKNKQINQLRGQGYGLYDRKRHIAATEDFIEDSSEIKKTGIHAMTYLDSRQQAFDSRLNALSGLLELRDLSAASHHKSVSVLFLAIAEELKKGKNYIDCVQTAAWIKDIGKISILSIILRSPAKLHNIKYKMIKNCLLFGYGIIKVMNDTFFVDDKVLQHHKKLNPPINPNGTELSLTLLEDSV